MSRSGAPRLELMLMLMLMATALTCVLSACGSADKPRPVALVLNEDSCAQCRMAVSQRPFAAEIAKPSGTAEVFDDIGCLVAYLQEKGLPAGSAAYVTDCNSGAWLDASAATYLWAKEMPTPMSYGLAAFASAQDAGATAKQWPGKIVDWNTLQREFKP